MISLAEFKKYFIYILIGSLIVAALVAVVSVLIGEFNQIAGKVIITLGLVIIHSLVSLLFIWDDERQGTFSRLSFFINVIFILIILSFLTSIFGVWNLISEGIVGNLYQSYFILAFASLHADILSKALKLKNHIDIVIYINYIFMVFVVAMFMPVIFIDNAVSVLGEMYFRILGAAGIIDGTLSILVIIFYKLFMQKHPKIQAEYAKKKKGLSWWVWLLIIFLIVQIVIPLLVLVFGLISASLF
ncbi:hypothetical protein H6503_04630 [Candidatus Woesearchaeota archaeon]|nr:hypothetical protein [Candidatus Woesearchaeota archaeon]